MAITYPILLPFQSNNKTIIQSYTLRMVENIGVTESPFTFKQQIQDYGAQRWELELTTIPLYGADARNVRGFLTSLRGRLGTFWVPLPQTLGNGYEIDTFAGAEATTLSATWDGSQTSDDQYPLNRGTYFSINNELYMTTSDRDANGDFEITPPLRTAVTIGTTMGTTYPIGVWRLMNNDASFSVDVTEGHSLTIACHEAFI